MERRRPSGIVRAHTRSFHLVIRELNVKSSFMYSDKTLDDSVNLYLFATPDGVARADVKGPVTMHCAGGDEVFEAMSALPLPKAFAYAIRVANRNDVSIVVSGNKDLWDHSWGWLGTNG